MKYFLYILIVCCVANGCADNNPSGTVIDETPTQIPGETPVEKSIDGEAIFKANCASCHKCMEDATGPALHGAFKRWATKEGLIDFVRSSKIAVADSTHMANLKAMFGSNYKHSFRHLNENEIISIIDRCDYYKQ